jgi:predicted PurR-regulated permease PerM
MDGNRAGQPVADGAWNTERIVRLAALVVLAIACVQVVFPFAGALTWAGIIAISVWPAFVWLSNRLGHRPVLAAMACTLVLTTVLVVPFAWMAASLGQAVPEVARLVGDLAGRSLPPPPAWVAGIPAVGPIIAEAWRSAATDMPSVIKELAPGAEKAGVWALSQGAGIALAVLEFLFAILISGLLLVTADRASVFAERIVARLNIGGGGRLLETVVKTIRSVSIGIVGTAAVQAMVATAGFAVAGVPGVALLGFLTFLVALVQLPTLLVWAPAALWLWVDDQTTAAIGLGIYGAVVINSVDNFLRPWLISRGARLPFALIFIGVIGGLLAWGMIGLFIGPTFLAVAYSLVRTWLGEAAEAVGVPPPTK